MAEPGQKTLMVESNSYRVGYPRRGLGQNVVRCWQLIFFCYGTC